jgi:hypothetical protein
MAITTTTISKNAGWAKTDLIYQLEEAFTWLGFHGPQISGIVTGISAYNGGGTVGSSGTDFHEVFAATTSGIGTGASFYVQRSSGSILYVQVNRPGVGYTNGEYVTLSADDIGGSANGATGIGLTVLVAGGASPVGYGSTTTFFDSEISGTYPWGMVRHQIDPNKKFGTTYRGVQANSTTSVSFGSGSGFHPWDTTNNADRGNMYNNRWAGTGYFDVFYYPGYSYNEVSTGTPNLGGYASPGGITVAGSTSYQLDLNLYRSGLDPNFAVFAYKHPTLSSTILSDNNYGVFFFHNFTTSIWDLDYLFLGGMTTISPDTGNTSAPKITFNTYLQGSSYSQKRSAEWGYGSSFLKRTIYESSIYSQSSIDEVSFYTRTANNSTGGEDSSQTLNSNTFHNAVIKGLPLCAQMAPCPYYLPDDFVMIDFQINTPSANVQQGDTITISGSEVYTIITASYNQTTTTRGIAFCARKV